MKATATRIQVNELRLYGFHGVSAEEQQVGNWYLIDIDLEAHISVDALSHDNLSGTIDHATIVEAVKREFNTKSHLLENVAYRIVKRLFALSHRVQEVHIKVQKVAPPIAENIRSTSVEFRYVN